MKEAPLYQMFDLIAQSGVGNLGNAGWIITQLFLSMFLEIKFLYAAMKKKSPLTQVAVAMIPMVLIATYSIGCGLIFGAFLGNGPTAQEMIELVNLTLGRRCVYEMLFAVAVFFTLTLLYSIVYRLKPLEWLVTFGVEMLAALALLILYGGLFFSDFPFTILDLCDRDLYLARLPIYGYFTLLFKCVVLLMSLFLGFVLREHKEKPLDEAVSYQDRNAYYERKAMRFVTKDYRLIGISFCIFSVAAEAFFFPRMIEEQNGAWSGSVMLTALLAGVLFALPGAMGISLLYHALRPQTNKVYRQLLAMDDPPAAIRYFCEEIVDRPPKTNFWTNTVQIHTAHFWFWRQGIRAGVEWRG